MKFVFFFFLIVSALFSSRNSSSMPILKKTSAFVKKVMQWKTVIYWRNLGCTFRAFSILVFVHFLNLFSGEAGGIVQFRDFPCKPWLRCDGKLSETTCCETRSVKIFWTFWHVPNDEIWRWCHKVCPPLKPGGTDVTKKSVFKVSRSFSAWLERNLQCGQSQQRFDRRAQNWQTKIVVDLVHDRKHDQTAWSESVSELFVVLHRDFLCCQSVCDIET